LIANFLQNLSCLLATSVSKQYRSHMSLIKSTSLPFTRNILDKAQTKQTRPSASEVSPSRLLSSGTHFHLTSAHRSTVADSSDLSWKLIFSDKLTTLHDSSENNCLRMKLCNCNCNCNQADLSFVIAVWLSWRHSVAYNKCGLQKELTTCKTTVSRLAWQHFW